MRLRVQKIWTVQQGVWTCRTMHRRVCGSSQLDWEEFMLFQSPGWLRLVDNSNCIFCLNHERSPLFSCWLIPASATCLWLLDILAIEKVVAGKYGAMAVSKQIEIIVYNFPAHILNVSRSIKHQNHCRNKF